MSIQSSKLYITKTKTKERASKFSKTANVIGLDEKAAIKIENKALVT